MANAPGKDVFEDDAEESLEDVLSEAIPADETDDHVEAAAGAGDDDLEVVVIEDGDDTVEGGDDTLQAGAEDTVEGAAADPDDELDEEARGYSTAVQKRIMREVRAKRRAREEGEQAVLAERAQRIEETRERMKVERALNEVMILNFANDIKEKLAALKRAKEDGDTDKEVEISSELADLQGRKRDLEGNKTRLEESATAFEEKAKVELQPTSREIPKATQDWLERNAWIKNPAFKAQAAFVRGLDVRLARVLPPTDPRYFQELDKLIAKELPELKTQIQATARRPAANGTRAQSAVAPGGRSAGAGRTSGTSSKNRVTLTKADVQNMRDFKMDPKNPAHLKQYARAKASR